VEVDDGQIFSNASSLIYLFNCKHVKTMYGMCSAENLVLLVASLAGCIQTLD
jgi:hypothetical protein